MDRLVQHQQTINDQLARYGVKFGLYKNGTFQERLFNRLYKTQLAPEKRRLKLLTDSLLNSSKPTASVPEQIEALEGLFLDL